MILGVLCVLRVSEVNIFLIFSIVLRSNPKLFCVLGCRSPVALAKGDVSVVKNIVFIGVNLNYYFLVPWW
jgi:hypothetical protein